MHVNEKIKSPSGLYASFPLSNTIVKGIASTSIGIYIGMYIYLYSAIDSTIKF